MKVQNLPYPFLRGQPLKCSTPCIIRQIQKSLGPVKVQANTSFKQFKLIEIAHWLTSELLSSYIVSLNSSLVRLSLRLSYLLESGFLACMAFICHETCKPFEAFWMPYIRLG